MSGVESFKVEVGDFAASGGGFCAVDYLRLPKEKGFLRNATEKIPMSQLALVELATEESVKRIGGGGRLSWRERRWAPS